MNLRQKNAEFKSFSAEDELRQRIFVHAFFNSEQK